VMAMDAEAIEQRHAECRESVCDFGDWSGVSHECPPCPHGKIRGGAFKRHGDPWVDQHQRLMMLQVLEKLRCEDDHPGASVRGGVA
jgi:hypothetical protein